MNEINFRNLERELESCFVGIYKRIWIQYSRLGTVCLTVFPINGTERYRIIVEKNVSDFSVDNLKNIVLLKN